VIRCCRDSSSLGFSHGSVSSSSLGLLTLTEHYADGGYLLTHFNAKEESLVYFLLPCTYSSVVSGVQVQEKQDNSTTNDSAILNHVSPPSLVTNSQTPGAAIQGADFIANLAMATGMEDSIAYAICVTSSQKQTGILAGYTIGVRTGLMLSFHRVLATMTCLKWHIQ